MDRSLAGLADIGLSRLTRQPVRPAVGYRDSRMLEVVQGTLILLVGLTLARQATGQPDPDAFDGSFRLETGEVVTGGYFVEDAEGRFLYMDTEHLDKGGLFERIDESLLRSVVPPGSVEIEFLPGTDGRADALVWREEGREPVSGKRVHAHRSQAIEFASGDGTRLRGRLLLPECPGPHPVVVSVHGSGPVNRYGGSYHTYFLKHGMAVLAYDKRGYTTDSDAWREPDLATLSADVAAAVRFAAAHDELHKERVGIFGSSQAGWVVPRAAAEVPETRFIILRAGPAVSELEAHLHEIRQELRTEGLEGLELDYAIGLRRELAMAGKPLSATDALVGPYLHERWYEVAFGEGPVSQRWPRHWWAWAGRNMAVTATPYLERFEGPVLWFLAELDENVPLVPSRAALERAFSAAPGGDQEVVVLDEALHSFLVPDPDGPPQFSDGFFDRMALWMEERGYTEPACWDG